MLRLHLGCNLVSLLGIQLVTLLFLAVAVVAVQVLAWAVAVVVVGF
jgi:hypothetical protein